MTLRNPYELLGKTPTRFVVVTDMNLEDTELFSNCDVKLARHIVDTLDPHEPQMPVPADPAWQQLTEAEYDEIMQRYCYSDNITPHTFAKAVWRKLTTRSAPHREISRTYWLGEADEKESKLGEGLTVRTIEVGDITPPEENTANSLFHSENVDSVLGRYDTFSEAEL